MPSAHGDVGSTCAGKIVLVTGAQRGIGRAVALRFGQARAGVALNFLDDEAGAQTDSAHGQGGARAPRVL